MLSLEVYNVKFQVSLLINEEQMMKLRKSTCKKKRFEIRKCFSECNFLSHRSNS